MKKILSILLAVSMIATAAFAATPGATLTVSGSMLAQPAAYPAKGYASDDFLKLDNGTVFTWVGMDANCGGTYIPAYGVFSVWFKPIDALTVSAGDVKAGVGYNLLTAGNAYSTSGKLAFAFDVDPVSVSLVVPNQKKFGSLGAKLGFNTDVGAVAIVFQTANEFKDFAVYGELKSDTLVDGLSLNLAGGVVLDNGKKAVINLHPYAGFAIDAVSCGAQADIRIADATSVDLAFTAGYDLDDANNISVTAAFGLYEGADKWVEGDFTQKIPAAIDCSWTVGAKYDIGYSKFLIPLSVSVSF